LRKAKKQFAFASSFSSITEVLVNHDLASLGDAYVNFAYSLALSKRKGKPLCAKVKGSILAEAIKKAGLREYLPSRMTRHRLADAAEALTVYAWLNEYITLEESVILLEESEDPIEGFRKLLTVIRSRLQFF